MLIGKMIMKDLMMIRIKVVRIIWKVDFCSIRIMMIVEMKVGMM